MTTTTNIKLNQPAYNSTSPTWDQPLNYNATILDQVVGNTTSISVSTSGTPSYTLVSAPSSSGAGGTSQCMRLSLTGALASNQTVLLPQSIAGMWIITNSTSNSFTVTIGSNDGTNSGSAGTSVVVPQGFSTIVYCDGTNVKKADDGITQSSSVTTFSAGTTGLLPSSATSNAITLTGTLNIANGGTGQTTASAAFNALSPITSTGDLIIGNGTSSATRLSIGTNGYVLTSTGTTATWSPATGGGGSGGGTVTSIGVTVPSFLSVSPSTITTNGTFAISLSGTALPISSGGTGQTTSSAAFNALSPIAALGDLIVGTGTNTGSRLPIGSNGYVLTVNSGTAVWAAQTGGGGSGTVTSVNASGGSTGLSFSGGPITSSGTLTLGGTLIATYGGTGITNYANANNALYSNSATTLTAGTLPVAAGGTGISTTPSNGQIDIGNGSGFTRTTLTAGSGINITNGSGAITIYTPITTTGDLIIGNGTNSATRLAIGTNGYILTSNGTTASWQPSTSGSGTVNSGTSGQLAYYASTGTAVSGTATGTGVITALSSAVTGSGGMVLSISPTLTTPTIGVATATSLSASGNITSSSGNITATTGNVTAPGGYVSAGSSAYPRIENGAAGYYNIDFSSTTGISWQSGVGALSFGVSGTQVVAMTTSALTSNVTPYANQTSWTLISDQTYKKDVTPKVVAESQQRILGLKPVDFTWIQDNKKDAGFIAQDFEQIYPQNVVDYTDNKINQTVKAITINMNFYSDIIAVIQDQQKQIIALQDRLTSHNL